MPKTMVAVSIDPALLRRIDALVAERRFADRGAAVESALVAMLKRRKTCRLARECAKLAADADISSTY